MAITAHRRITYDLNIGGNPMHFSVVSEWEGFLKLKSADGESMIVMRSKEHLLPLPDKSFDEDLIVVKATPALSALLAQKGD